MESVFLNTKPYPIPRMINLFTSRIICFPTNFMLSYSERILLNSTHKCGRQYFCFHISFISQFNCFRTNNHFYFITCFKNALVAVDIKGPAKHSYYCSISRYRFSHRWNKVRITNEISHKMRNGISINFRGITHLFNMPFIHNNDFIGKTHGF